MMYLCKWAADYYQYPLGQVLFSTLPLKLKKGANRDYYSNSKFKNNIENTDIKIKVELNDDQKKTYEEIISHLSSFNVNLLEHNQSGKTEVYIKLAEKILINGGQILILVPEINLTPQTVSRFEKHLNCDVAVIIHL